MLYKSVLLLSNNLYCQFEMVYFLLLPYLENKGRPWHSFEAFTIIIREQVKALIKLGASAKLKVSDIIH